MDFEENLLIIKEVVNQMESEVSTGHGLRVIMWKLWNLFIH